MNETLCTERIANLLINSYLVKIERVKNDDIPEDMKKRNYLWMLNIYLITVKLLSLFFKENKVDSKAVLHFKVKTNRFISENSPSFSCEDICNPNKDNKTKIDVFIYEMLFRQSTLDRYNLLRNKPLGGNIFE